MTETVRSRVLAFVRKTGQRNPRKVAAALKLSQKEVAAVLQKSASLQKTKRLKFPRVQHDSFFPGQKLYFDLIDLKGGQIPGKGFILTVLDHYSRFAWAHHIKNKKAASVWRKFGPVYDEVRPQYLIADKGPEWAQIHKIHPIRYGDPDNKGDTAPIERLNRTLLELLLVVVELEEEDGGKRSLQEMLDDVVQSYNETEHTATKKTPKSIFQGKKLSESDPQRNYWKAKPGDKFRIVLAHGRFAKKARAQKLSDEVLDFVKYTHGYYGLSDGKTYSVTDIYPVKAPTGNSQNEAKAKRIAARKERLAEERRQREGVEQKNIIEGKRKPKPKRPRD